MEYIVNGELCRRQQQDCVSSNADIKEKKIPFFNCVLFKCVNWDLGYGWNCFKSKGSKQSDSNNSVSKNNFYLKY